MLSKREKDYCKDKKTFNEYYQATMKSRVKKKIKKIFDDFELILDTYSDNDLKDFLLDKLRKITSLKSYL